MTRIANVDQVMALLRQQLNRLGKSDRSRKTGTAGALATERRQPAAVRIAALGRADGMSDDALSRNLVAALLVDEFGERTANDHKFRELAEEVYRIISSDAETNRLLSEALKEIRKSAT